ncbi:MAG: hypothetical protein ACI9R3_002841 [Verrucomicrobiales bacterium]|jgi:hypothetical protein
MRCSFTSLLTLTLAGCISPYSGAQEDAQDDAAPDVHMLVPGFVVEPLPLKLPNINNVIYRPDGKLIAGAYDGNVYLLSDSDGDGLEDTAKLWWDCKGNAWTTGNCADTSWLRAR